ncbi:hypothetical protein AMECASPLE_032611 [Ameca splendens]|uniref:Uncharacterized protein n=1 Tax=Ameca splendens TaxID=208324 RepID=A0ABV1A345_9TELE
MVGPRLCVQFGLLNPVGVSPGPPGARGPAGEVLELAVGFVFPGPSQLLGCSRSGLVGAVHSVSMTACPSPPQIADILAMLPSFCLGRAPRFVEYLRLLGMLTAASSVVPLELLSLRPLQMWLNGVGLDPS